MRSNTAGSGCDQAVSLAVGRSRIAAQRNSRTRKVTPSMTISSAPISSNLPAIGGVVSASVGGAGCGSGASSASLHCCSGWAAGTSALRPVQRRR